jgi:AcrR family transcriptional regulator
VATTTPGARGPYAKTAQVRQRILEACTEVFAENGYRATTMKEIAERAGISQRGLAHHFAGKAELLGAVIELREAESARLMAPVGTAVESFVSMLTVIADNSRRPGLVELSTVLSAEGVSPEHPAHDHFQRRNAGLREYFTRAFERLRDEGELASDVDSRSLAVGFVGLMEGVQVLWLYDKRAIDIDAVLRAHLETLIPRFASP